MAEVVIVDAVEYQIIENTSTSGVTQELRWKAGFGPVLNMPPLRVCKTADQAHTATAYANVTELGFNLLLGQRYSFFYLLVFRSAALTTGFGFSLNGPAFTSIHYLTRYQIVANGSTGAFAERADVTYDAMAAVTSAIAANADLACTIEGAIIPSASGVLIPRVRSEVAGSAITVRQGSFGRLES